MWVKAIQGLYTAIFLSGAACLHPVQDFRVPDMPHPQVDRLDDSIRITGTSRSTSANDTDTNSNTNIVELGAYVQSLWTDSYNSIYYINTTMANSGSGYTDIFPLLLDTGSSVLWIYSSNCSSDMCTKIPRFNASGVISTSSFSVSYSGDIVHGPLVDAAANNITWRWPCGLSLSNYTFGLGATVPLFFKDYAVSGILGIPATDDRLVPPNLLVQLGGTNTSWPRRFGLILGPDSDNTNSLGGVFLLGDEVDTYEDVLATKPVHFCNLVASDNAYWLVTVSGVYVAGNTAVNGSRNAIIDTGTTGLLLPQEDADALHTALFGDAYVLDGAGNYAFPCNASAQVDFEIGGANFSIDVSSIRGAEYTTSVLEGYCASKAQGTGDGDNWILGASFLQNFYTVFDLENEAIGLAPRVESYVLREPKVSTLTLDLNKTQTQTQTQTQTLLLTLSQSLTGLALNLTSLSHSGAGARAGASAAVVAILAWMY